MPDGLKKCLGGFILALCFLGGAPSLSAQQDDFVTFSHKGRVFSIPWMFKGANTYVYNPGAPKKLLVATLDWPPYVGEDICKQGWVQQFTVALLASQGYEITCRFLPWARAVSEVENGNYDLLYPEYYIEPSAPSDVIKGTFRTDHLALSHSFEGGTLAFIKRKSDPDDYRGNLKGKRIGLVRGYQNTPGLDALIDNGFFDVSLAVDDLMNALKLVQGRVDLILGDPAVIRYRLAVSKLSAAQRQQTLDQIEVVAQTVQPKDLYFAVSKKRPHWQETLEAINRGVEEFQASGLIMRIKKDVEQGCPPLP